MNDLRLSETHVSWLFFTSDHVYKVKKPVVFGFLDLSRREARARACQAEVELNSRLSADVYDGVGVFQYPDGRCEPVVVMKRLPEDRSLSALVRAGQDDLDQDVTDVAAVMARFHRQGPPGTPDRYWRARRRLSDSFGSAIWLSWPRWRRTSWTLPYWTRWRRSPLVTSPAGKPCSPSASGPGELSTATATSFATMCSACRTARGYWTAWNSAIPCGMSTPCPMSLPWPWISSALDRPDLASVFLDSYRRLSGDEWPASLAHFYMAYRAASGPRSRASGPAPRGSGIEYG